MLQLHLVTTGKPEACKVSVGLRYPRGAGIGVELPAEGSLIPVGVGEILREGSTVAVVDSVG